MPTQTRDLSGVMCVAGGLQDGERARVGVRCAKVCRLVGRGRLIKRQKFKVGGG